jgi:hypothetical protein
MRYVNYSGCYFQLAKYLLFLDMGGFFATLNYIEHGKKSFSYRSFWLLRSEIS